MSKADQLLTALLASDSTSDELRQALQPFNWPEVAKAAEEDIKLLCIQAALNILLKPNTRFGNQKKLPIHDLDRQLEEAKTKRLISENKANNIASIISVHRAVLSIAGRQEEADPPINTSKPAVKERSKGKMSKKQTEIELATKKRSQTLMDFTSEFENSCWRALYERPPADIYKTELVGETDALPPGARHAILWSLQPATLQLESYLVELASFLSDTQLDIVMKLRAALQKDVTFPSTDRDLFGPKWSNFMALATELNDKVPEINLKTTITHLSQSVSWFEGDAHTSLSELDFERKVYSATDVAFENLPQQSNKEEKNQRPDFMVFNKEGNAPIIIAEDGQELHSAVGHKDTYKVFEQCQSALEENAKQGVYRQIMGQLNGGKRSTVFIASCIQVNDQLYYKLRWLKNGLLNYTFDYSYEFVPQIFMLYLCFHLAKPTFKAIGIKKSSFKPTVRAKGKSSRKSDALFKKEITRSETDANNNNNTNSNVEDEDDQEDDQPSDTMRDALSLPVGSQLGIFTVTQRLNKSVVHLEELSRSSDLFTGKICKLKNGAPWELLFIQNMPLRTILQPHHWCTLTTEHYLMIYKKVPTTQIQSYFAGILREIFLTFEYLHEQGIVHANVKFNNAFVQQNRFFLTDFDKAGQLADVQNREFVGTTGHVAPELFAGKSYSFAAEMYSVGVMLIEMFHDVPLAGVFKKYANNFDWYKQNHVDIHRGLLQIFDCSTSRRFYKIWGRKDAVLDCIIPMPMLEAFKRLIHALLSVDPTGRPTAHQVLYGDEYKDLWIKEKSGRESILSNEPSRTWRFEVDLPKKKSEEKPVERAAILSGTPQPVTTSMVQSAAMPSPETLNNRTAPRIETENDGKPTAGKSGRPNARHGREPLAEISSNVLITSE